jgi:hypothetical protein
MTPFALLEKTELTKLAAGEGSNVSEAVGGTAGAAGGTVAGLLGAGGLLRLAGADMRRNGVSRMNLLKRRHPGPPTRKASIAMLLAMLSPLVGMGAGAAAGGAVGDKLSGGKDALDGLATGTLGGTAGGIGGLTGSMGLAGSGALDKVDSAFKRLTRGGKRMPSIPLAIALPLLGAAGGAAVGRRLGSD